MNLEFSCTLYEGKGLNKKYRNLVDKVNPSKQEMVSYLNCLERSIGAAGLRFIPEPDVGISELSVQFDGEKCLFTLTEYSETGEYLIRGRSGFSGKWELVEFLLDGELYPSNAMTTDFDFIKKVFVELLETGEVSHDLMERIY